MKHPSKSAAARRGIAVVEFTLASLVLIPMLLGTFVFGFKLIRALQMQQIVRDIGHMYVQGVNFRSAGSLQVAQTLSSAFALTSTGTSELLLSQISIVQQADCDAGNPATPGRSCANLNKPAFLERLVIGNSGLSTSMFGTPPVGGTQLVSAYDRANTPAAAATNFSPVLALNAGEIAYVTEMINYTPDLSITGLSGAPIIYARSIY